MLFRSLTLADVLDGPADAPVEGAGVGRTLEGQAKLLVVDPPVVEDGVDLVIDQVLLHDALQHNLDHTHTHTEEEKGLLVSMKHNRK